MNEYPAALARAILSSLTEGLIIGDLDGNVLDMNAAALVVHGFDSPEVARRHLRDYAEHIEMQLPTGQVIHLNEWPLSRAIAGEAFAGYEVIVRRIDTGQEWRNVYSGTPVQDADGKTVRVLLTVHEVGAPSARCNA